MWDAAGGGSQIGGDNVSSYVVVDGRFTADLDFGADSCNGQGRWLEIEVCCPSGCAPGYTPLSPRQELAPSPYALALPGLFTQQNPSSPNLIGGYSGNTVTAGVVGATVAGGGASLNTNRVTDSYGTIGGGSNNQAGDAAGTIADKGYATVGGGRGNTASNVYSTVGGGSTNTVNGIGSTVGGGSDNTASNFYSAVGGGSTNTSNGSRSTVGGGSTNTANGSRSTVGGGGGNTASELYSTVGGGGTNTASGMGATVPGGYRNLAGGDYSFAAGRDAKARDSDPASTYYSGDTNGDEGTFVWADSTGADLTSTGPNQFLIRADGGVGIGHNSPAYTLDVRTTTKSYAIYAESTSTSPVTRDGVYGFASVNQASSGGLGIGVRGYSDCNNSAGSYTQARGGYFTAYADSLAYGVHGSAYSDTANAYGVRGYAVAPSGSTAYGVYGSTSGGGTRYAGYFYGNVHVSGTLSKGAGAFKIDHPLDPKNKYLSHSFVESPDMMNVYNGNVVLDGNGEATVEMADWFDALNRDFRYQLTPIGAPGPNLYVAQEIRGNAFRIAGGTAGIEVSWQVTGIRQDAFANANRIVVEEDKPQNERGLYLHPEAFGVAKELGVNYEQEHEQELLTAEEEAERAEPATDTSAAVEVQ